jgi:5'-nucleotidase (lipoprotein e(P4) family)
MLRLLHRSMCPTIPAKRIGLAVALFVSLYGGPVAAEPPAASTANLDAVLWMQKAPEYGFAALGQWRALEAQLPLLRRGGDALVSSEVPDVRKPRRKPAIIVDLDETVLDNSPANAETPSGLAYDEARWQGWLARVEEQYGVPGAVATLNAAKRQGFQIFYISNRECPAATAPAKAPHPDCLARRNTMAVLKRLGLPYADDPGVLLLRNDQRGWQDKTARRRHVARDWRVAALVGDDVRDFLPRTEAEALVDSIGRTGTIGRVAADPTSVFSSYQAHIGRDWFVMPNPAYGSWERGQGSRVACVEPKLSGTDCAEASLAAKQGRLVLPGSRQRLRLATWNMEWLMLPEVRDALLATCVAAQPPSAVRGLPCPREPYPPVARHDAADLAMMARYAARAGADVVALQEVDGPQAAAAVFPGYQNVCFVKRAHPQKTGFAVRAGIPFRCNGDLVALDDDGAARAGADITLWPDTPHAIRLLSVHLKSGCFELPLTDRTNPVCERLQAQAPILARWVAERQDAGEAFAILGDFNRRLEIDAALEAGPDAAPVGLWATMTKAGPLARVTDSQTYRPCRAGERYTSWIDNIVLGGKLAETRRNLVHIGMSDAPKAAVLSDHCVIGVDLWGWPQPAS